MEDSKNVEFIRESKKDTSAHYGHNFKFKMLNESYFNKLISSKINYLKNLIDELDENQLYYNDKLMFDDKILADENILQTFNNSKLLKESFEVDILYSNKDDIVNDLLLCKANDEESKKILDQFYKCINLKN